MEKTKAWHVNQLLLDNGMVEYDVEQIKREETVASFVTREAAEEHADMLEGVHPEPSDEVGGI